MNRSIISGLATVVVVVSLLVLVLISFTTEEKQIFVEDYVATNIVIKTNIYGRHKYADIRTDSFIKPDFYDVCVDEKVKYGDYVNGTIHSKNFAIGCSDTLVR